MVAASHERAGVALALRSRIVLSAAAAVSSSEIGRDLGVSVATVRKWRNRFAVDRLDGLVDEAAPGPAADDHRSAGRRGRDQDVGEHAARRNALVDAVDGPGGRIDAVGGVRDLEGVWVAAHRQEKWKLSTDPQFVAKVRDIVGLYLNPPERAVVLAVDEETPTQ